MVTSLSSGAANDDASQVIRRHLSPALAGPGWDAVIAALGESDQINWDNARLAFDQLFASTAGGNYLTQRGGDVGVKRPAGVGMPDDLFRQLVIQLRTSVLTHDSLRKIMEIFYGEDASRGWTETANWEPFAVKTGDTLTWTLDEAELFTREFVAADFATQLAVTAVELAAAINATLDITQSSGFAVALVDPDTGVKRVRLYSGSLGLKSFVRVTGGTAQPVLRFNDYVEAYAGTVTVGLGYSWTVTAPVPGQTKFSLTTVGQPLVDVSAVQAGDYVVLGTATPFGARTVNILDVGFSWSAGSLTQTFTVDQDLGWTGSYTQQGNDDFRFFRPTKRSVAAGTRTVIVAQTGSGISIEAPATSQVVSRGPGLAAYGRAGTDYTLSKLMRLPDGSLSVDLVGPPPPISVGQLTEIAGFVPGRNRPWVTAGTPGTYPDVALADVSFGTNWSATQEPPSRTTQYGSAALLGSGDLLWTGGVYTAASVYAGSQDFARILHLVGKTTLADTSEASGTDQLRYQWYAAQTMSITRFLHESSAMSDGRVMVTGGISSGLTPITSVELYSQGLDTWLTANSLALPRFGHQQIGLATGGVLVCGGVWNSGTTASATSENFDPGTLSWTSAGNMSVPRYRHRALQLTDGRVMVTGGNKMGQAIGPGQLPLAYWHFDDTGTTLTDSSGNAYDLTATGAGAVDSKVGYGFSMAARTATAAGDAGAVTGLTAAWTAEFWLAPSVTVPGAAASIIAYGTVGAGGVAADNILLQVGIDNNSRIWWTWETGAGVPVTATQTLGPALNTLTGGAFVAVRKKYIGGAPGFDYQVDLFINGVLTESWTGLGTSTGGTNSQWYLGTDPRGGAAYQGVVDELRISKFAVSDTQILDDYLVTKGLVLASGNTVTDSLGGDVTDTTEFWDPTTGVWTPGPRMTWARAWHQMFLLPDGRVVVFGGYGRRSGDPLPVQDQTFYAQWPNVALRTAEVWDPATNRWDHLPSSQNLWVGASAAQTSLGIVVANPQGGSPAYGGIGTTEFPDGLAMEVFDTQKLTWRRHWLTVTAGFSFISRDAAWSLPGGYALFTGGKAGGDSLVTADLLIPGQDRMSAGDINGFHTVASVGIQTGDTGFATNWGSPNTVGDRYYNTAATRYLPFFYTWQPSAATRLANVTTLALGTTVGLSVGQQVWVNLDGNTGYGTGIKTLTAVDAAGVSYADPGTNAGPTAVVGALSVQTSTPTLTMAKAVAGPTWSPGPYVLDPVSGVPVTGTETTMSAIVGIQGDRLQVASTTGFPDQSGYLVLGFGTEHQSPPIRYLEVVGPTTLLLEYGQPVTGFAVGTKVTLLSGRTPVQTAPGAFYLTASNQGRVVAEQVCRDAIAGGFDLNFKTIYPSDRGLGNEGYPTSGNGKFSDAVGVWGDDNYKDGSQ